MEESPASEYTPAFGSDDGEKALCDGLGVDDQWEHQRIYQGTQGCESVRARRVLLPPDSTCH